MPEIRPQVALDLARSGCLDVEDLHDSMIHARNIACTARFERHLKARITQAREEFERTVLRKRLTARQSHAGDIKFPYSLDDRIDAHQLAA